MTAIALGMPARTAPSSTPGVFRWSAQATSAAQPSQATGPVSQPQSSKKECGERHRQDQRHRGDRHHLRDGRAPEDRSVHHPVSLARYAASSGGSPGIDWPSQVIPSDIATKSCSRSRRLSFSKRARARKE